MGVDVSENMASLIASTTRAKKLIQMDAKGGIDKVKNKAINEGKMSYDEDGMVSSKISEHHTNLDQYTTMPSGFKTKSKLPMEIIESFKNNPISCNNPYSMGGSVLDMLQGNQKQQITESVKNDDNDIVESAKTVKQPIVQQTVDYSMIKMIVEDCLRKQLNSIKKTIITESANKANDGNVRAMRIGDKFNFITDDGDLYEAKLTFIKNINNKKGGK